jgi:benzoyl-CoA reductase/2-hydroxyglutaryl-CoA dehydratase subunit BcrC/BadD/HgdB
VSGDRGPAAALSGDRGPAAALRAAAERPAAAAAAWQAGGGLVVGMLGWSAPRELVTAAGLLPVRLSPDRLAGPDSGGAPEPAGADGLDRVAAGLGRELTPGTARIAAALVSGALGWIDFLVIGRDREDYTKLFYLLRELRRSGAAPGLLPVAFFDLLRLPSRTSARYNRQRAAELTAVLAGWAGRPVTPADLASAVEATKVIADSFGAIQTLRTHRPHPAITGSDALAAAIAARVLPADRLRPLLDAVLAAGTSPAVGPALAAGTALPAGPVLAAGAALAADAADPADRPVLGSGMSRAGAHDIPEISTYGSAGRVFLAGSAVDDLTAYEALEALGLAVVGEDHEWGDDGSEYPRVTRDPLDGIVDRYHFAHGGAARAGLRDRVAHTVDRVRAADADGVLYLLGAHDEAAGWELPVLRDRLGAGLPLVPVRLRDPGQPGASGHQELTDGARRLLDQLGGTRVGQEARHG